MSIMDSTGDGNRMAPSLCSRCKVCLWWCGRACHWLPVLVILGIVSWSYYAYVIELCLRTLDNVIQQCTYMVIYHFLIIMFMWSYWRTICTTAKQIPSKYKLPPAEIQKLLSAESEDAQRAILEEFAKELPVFTRTNSGAIRYCNRCVLIKPDRAHHCSICGKCVLKMDHHCPWVNNCVCYQNYKFFILFLGYAILYCIYIAATTLPSFIIFWKGDLQPQSNSRYHIVFVFFVALIFLISLMSLFVYHCYLVVKNRTTLGSLIGRHYSPKKKVELKRASENVIFANKLPPVVFKANGLTEAFRAPMFRSGSDRNGFNLGAYKNFKEVFGEDPKLWLIPVFSSLGDGTVFPVRQEHQLHTITLNQEPHGYESMGTTKSSFGDGQAFPLPQQDEDTESLLSSERWDRWGERARPFDERGSSSFDEL